MRYCQPISELFDWIIDRYVDNLIAYRRIVFYTFIGITLALSVVCIYCRALYDFTADPTQGFEVRGTPTANIRLAMEKIIQQALPLYRLLERKEYASKNVLNFRLTHEGVSWGSTDYFISQQGKFIEADFPFSTDTLSVSENVDASSELTEVIVRNINNDSELTINYDDYGVGYRPQWSDIRTGCDEYFAMGSFFPHSTLKFLLKAVFKLASSETIFQIGKEDFVSHFIFTEFGKMNVNFFDESSHGMAKYFSGILEMRNDECNLFQVETYRQLCKLDDLIEALPYVELFRTPLQYSFNLPYYAMCVNGTVRNCSELTQENVEEFRDVIEYCLSGKKVSPERDSFCSMDISRQLQNIIFSKKSLEAINKTVAAAEAIYLGVVLRAQKWSPPDGGTTMADANFEFHNALLNTLRRAFPLAAPLEFVALDVGAATLSTFFRRNFVKEACRRVPLALIVILIIVLVYTRRPAFTVFCLVSTLLSVGAAYFVYSIIFGIIFLPFVNVLALVVVMTISADDIFLLVSGYEATKKELICQNQRAVNLHLQYSMPPPDHIYSLNGRRCAVGFGVAHDVSAIHLSASALSFSSSNADAAMAVRQFPTGRDEVSPERIIDENVEELALRTNLKEAIPAFFINTATTIVALLMTVHTSTIIVIRCFGVFAALATATTFLFAVSALPCGLLMLDVRRTADIRRRGCVTRISLALFRRLNALRQKFVCRAIALLEHLTMSIAGDPTLCYAVNAAFLVSGILSSVSVARHLQSYGDRSGIRLDSVQLLSDSHPLQQYYTVESQFDFNYYEANSTYRMDVSMKRYALWGVQPIRDASSYVPSRRGGISASIYSRWADAPQNVSALIEFERHVMRLALGRPPLNSTAPGDRGNQRPLLISTFRRWLTETENRSYSTDERHPLTRCRLSANKYAFDECFLAFIQQTGNYTQFGKNDATGGRKFLDSPIFVANNNANGGPPFLLLGYFLVVPLIKGNFSGDNVGESGMTSIQRYAGKMHTNFDNDDNDQEDASFRKSSFVVATGPTDAASAIELLAALRRTFGGEALCYTVAAPLAAATVFLFLMYCVTSGGDASTTLNVILSSAAAILLTIVETLAVLLFLGWRMDGVVECVVVVMAVGLAFNHVLHVAVAVQRVAAHHQLPFIHTIQCALNSTLGWITLATGSNLLVGLAILLDSANATRPLHQLATFLVAFSCCSLVTAVLALPSMMSMNHRVSKMMFR